MGRSDIWFLKLDADGNVQWQKIYGGDGQDYTYAIQPAADGELGGSLGYESTAIILYPDAIGRASYATAVNFDSLQ